MRFLSEDEHYLVLRGHEEHAYGLTFSDDDIPVGNGLVRGLVYDHIIEDLSNHAGMYGLVSYIEDSLCNVLPGRDLSPLR